MRSAALRSRLRRTLCITTAKSLPSLAGRNVPNPAMMHSFRRRQFLSGGGNERSLILQHMRNDNNRVVGPLPLLLLDGLADRRHRFRGVPGVEAGSVKLVLEPRAIGQAFGSREFALTFNQHLVHLDERSGSQRRAAIGARLLESFVVFARAAREGLHGVFHRREAQMRGNSFYGGRDQRAPLTGRCALKSL